MIRCANNHWYEIKPKRPSGEECPFCWVQRQRIKRFDAHKIKLSQDERFYNLYPSRIAEYERMKGIETPASFTGEKPDTPEAKAARRQIEITKGKDVPYR